MAGLAGCSGGTGDSGSNPNGSSRDDGGGNSTGSGSDSDRPDSTEATSEMVGNIYEDIQVYSTELRDGTVRQEDVVQVVFTVYNYTDYDTNVGLLCRLYDGDGTIVAENTETANPRVRTRGPHDIDLALSGQYRLSDIAHYEFALVEQYHGEFADVEEDSSK